MRTRTKNVLLVKTQYTDEYATCINPHSDVFPQEWVPITEIVSITFKKLSDSEIITKEVKILDKTMETLRQESLYQLEQLQNKKDKLLALTHIK